MLEEREMDLNERGDIIGQTVWRSTGWMFMRIVRIRVRLIPLGGMSTQNRRSS